jgi:hypothetical protein
MTLSTELLNEKFTVKVVKPMLPVTEEGLEGAEEDVVAEA